MGNREDVSESSSFIMKASMARGKSHQFFLLQFSLLWLGAVTSLPHSRVLRLDAVSFVKHVRTKQHWQFGFVIQDISHCQHGFVMWRISC